MGKRLSYPEIKNILSEYTGMPVKAFDDDFINEIDIKLNGTYEPAWVIEVFENIKNNPGTEDLRTSAQQPEATSSEPLAIEAGNDTLIVPDPTTPEAPAIVPTPTPPAPRPPALGSSKSAHNTAAKSAPKPPVTPPKPIVLPNGRQGEQYEYVIDWTRFELQPDHWIEHMFEGLAATGLSFDANTSIISGKPQQSGDQQVVFRFRPEANRPPLSRPVQLYINPDPRTLWTEHEPPSDVLYQKSHTDHFRSTEGERTFIVASKRGRSHAKDGKFRDDDFGFHYDPQSRWYIMVVGDGAGSAPYSREGSRIACKTAVEALSTGVLKDRLQELGQQAAGFQHKKNHAVSEESLKASSEDFQRSGYVTLTEAGLLAYQAIEAEAAAQGHQPKEYATTFLLAVCKKFGEEWFVGTFWIGDGAIGLYTQGEEAPTLMGEPDSGEYSGQTRFLTMSELFAPEERWKRLRLKFVDKFDALMLMSDGISDAWFGTDANLQRQAVWDKFYAEMQKEVTFTRDNDQADAQLLQWLDFWIKGEYDDRTLAILF